MAVVNLYILCTNQRATNQSTGSSSSSNLKLNGWNMSPSPTKCLLIASTQCNRRLCNIALVPSITQRIAIVRKNLEDC